MMVPHNSITDDCRECVFCLLVKTHSPTWHSLRLSGIVWQQSGLCVFRGAASACATFCFGGKDEWEKTISSIQTPAEYTFSAIAIGQNYALKNGRSFSPKKMLAQNTEDNQLAFVKTACEEEKKKRKRRSKSVMKKAILFLLLLIMILSLVACGSGRDKEKLIGTYHYQSSRTDYDKSGFGFHSEYDQQISFFSDSTFYFESHDSFAVDNGGTGIFVPLSPSESSGYGKYKLKDGFVLLYDFGEDIDNALFWEQNEPIPYYINEYTKKCIFAVKNDGTSDWKKTSNVPTKPE